MDTGYPWGETPSEFHMRGFTMRGAGIEPAEGQVQDALTDVETVEGQAIVAEQYRDRIRFTTVNGGLIAEHPVHAVKDSPRGYSFFVAPGVNLSSLQMMIIRGWLMYGPVYGPDKDGR